jgi:hypothetical protein
MFYRIFYTSWPQLLEAGRGGFGIVARHREIPTVISHAAEAASQFAPLRGEAVHRVVYAYRTETAQSGRWHILSRIEDSGSDYTGRTNYLAQHLVANDDVARSLASQGISPAMVMGAPDAWPRFDGQVGFIANPPWQVGQGPVRDGHWASFGDGNTDRRFLLAAGSNVTLAYPPHWQDSTAAAFILGLFDEAACCSRADCGWGTTFTTYLEPTDKPQDFCWIGLPADSALLPKLRDSGRPIVTESTPPPVRIAEPVISLSRKRSSPDEGAVDATRSSQIPGLNQSPAVSLASGRSLRPPGTGNRQLTPSDDGPARLLPQCWIKVRKHPMVAVALVLIAIAASLLVYSTVSKSSQPLADNLEVRYGEFNRDDVRRLLEKRGVPRDAQLQYSEQGQEQWTSQDPKDAGSYEIRRIIRRWLPILPDKEQKLPYTFIIDKVTPAIEWPRDLSFEDDAKPKPISPTITPAEAAASRIVEYKRPDESDEKWRRDPPSTPGEHQVRVVIPANANSNFVGVTSIVGFTIKEKSSGADQQDERDQAPPGSVDEPKAKNEFYLALSSDALSQANEAKIWPNDFTTFTRQDWSKEDSPSETINEIGGLGDERILLVYEMNANRYPVKIVDRFKNDYSNTPHIYTANSTNNREVSLISLRSSGDNLPAVRKFIEPRISVRKTSDNTSLELLDPDNFFNHTKLLPEDSKWILRVDLSQFDMSGYLDLTASTPCLFSLQDNLRRFEEQKTRAEATINQAAELSKQAADAGGFFETNKKLIIDEFNRLNEKYKPVAVSLIERLKSIQPPRTKEDEALSHEENLKALLIDALDCAFSDRAVGGWMQFSEKGREQASQAGDNWLKNLSESESLQLRPQHLSNWMELDPAKRAGVASVKGIAEKWLDARIKSLKEPPGNRGVEKEDVKQVLNALKHGIRRTGVSGQDSATALSPADVNSAHNVKDQAEKKLAFLASLGTPKATGSAQLLIQFPAGEQPLVLLPDVALKPGAETPN